MILAQSQYSQVLQQLIREVQERAFHPFVQEYVTYPPINKLQLHLTYLFLTSIGVSERQKSIIVKSQLFVQLGLDTHDDVPIVTQEEQVVTTRQLTVLSGDYFSSYYYLFLAEHNEIDLIQKWAKAIQEMNELKMELHVNKAVFSETEYRYKLDKLKALLTEHVLSWFEAEEKWFQMSSLLTQLSFWKGIDENERQIDGLLAEINALLKGFSSESIQNELALWLDGSQTTHSC